MIYFGRWQEVGIEGPISRRLLLGGSEAKTLEPTEIPEALPAQQVLKRAIGKRSRRIERLSDTVELQLTHTSIVDKDNEFPTLPAFMRKCLVTLFDARDELLGENRPYKLTLIHHLSATAPFPVKDISDLSAKELKRKADSLIEDFVQKAETIEPEKRINVRTKLYQGIN